MPRLREATIKKDELFETPVEKPDPIEEVEKKEFPTQEAAVEAAKEAIDQVVEEPPKPQEDPAQLALKKQIEDMRRADEQQRQYYARLAQERDEAVRRQVEAQGDAIASALTAANAKVEKAWLDIKSAREVGDDKAEFDAQRRLARAEAEIMAFEQGKDALEAQKKEQPAQQQREPQRPQTVEDIITAQKLPHNESQWLRERPEYITDRVKSEQLSYANSRVRGKNITPGHPDFLSEIEAELSWLDAGRNGYQAPPQQPQQRTNIVSAPVSREVPSAGGGTRSSGKVTLDAREKEAAKISGVTETEYARNKLKLAEMKANGEYGERR